MVIFRQSFYSVAAAIVLAFGLAATRGSAQAANAAATPAARPASIHATRAIVSLETSLNSKGDAKGKEIKLQLAQAVVLPDGTALPKGTVLHGLLAQTSPHSKTRPNGALLLLIDEARPKNGQPIPLLVKIRDLSPSAASEIERTELPGARLGGTSNSGGTQQMNADQNDHTEIRHNEAGTKLKGVYVDASATGSGVIFALGEDVYLDEGVSLTLVMARREPAQ